jgi:hypothetical protein
MPIRQRVQISESHCGPAVIQMLLEAMGVYVEQEEIAEAGGAAQTIEEHGMRVDQLAIACSKVAPHMQFWYKYHSKLDDIRTILEAGYAVAVEWQGLFYETEEEERAKEPDGDYGHYSVVIHFDEQKGELVIIDPYKDFINQNRIFSVNSFLRRWWDTNEIIDKDTGEKRIIEDVRMLFFVTPLAEEFPVHHGFKRFSYFEDDDEHTLLV